MSKPLMACGHVANAANDCTGTAACASCYGLTIDALIVADPQPDLTGRIARCNECRPWIKPVSERPSSTDLPFFEYRPQEEYDVFYCGCRGWE